MGSPTDGPFPLEALVWGVGRQPWPSTTRHSQSKWGLIKGGAQVGGRQHIEKDKVAQTEWDSILGKAQVGPLLPHCTVQLAALP